MGTVGQLANGSTTLSRQPHPSYSAYTNGDYGGQRWTSTSHSDDRITSHGAGADMNESRPASQGAGSAASGGQSRPTTSQGMVSTSSNSVVPAMQSRPESSGTEAAPQPQMRHGFDVAYSSEEYLNMLEQVHFFPRSMLLISGVLHVLYV